MNMAKLKGSTKFGKIAIGSTTYMSISAHTGTIEEKDDMISLGFCLCHVYGKQLELPWLTKSIGKMDPVKASKEILKTKEKTFNNINKWVSGNAFSFLFSSTNRNSYLILDFF